jgi:hypothetical protein
LGTGLTVDEAPSAKPFGPTGALGTVPSEEVTPSEGVTVPTWANAGVAHSRGQAVAIIKKGLMEDLPDKSGRMTPRACESAAVGKAAEAMARSFIIADRG